MMYFIALLVPTFLAFILMIFNHKKITLKEFLVQLLVQSALICLVISLSMSATISDVEVWNGEVTQKRHYSEIKTTTYPCRCRPKKGCSICTRSWTEWNWVVDNNLNETLCVRCGSLFPLPTPDLYNTIQVGDPTASIHTYENPIKAAPQSLFRNSGTKETKWEIPEYPHQVYDIIKLDRVVSVNGASIGTAWGEGLSEVNKRIGPKKQVNAIIVLVKDYPRTYYHTLREHWLGGKKNDIISVIGVDAQNNINWVEVMAWSKNSLIEVTLRDDLLSIGNVNNFKDVLSAIEAHSLKDYERKPMKDFEYLLSQATPTTTQWILFMLLSIVVSVGMSVFFYHNDLFNEETRKNRFY